MRPHTYIHTHVYSGPPAFEDMAGAAGADELACISEEDWNAFPNNDGEVWSEGIPADMTQDDCIDATEFSQLIAFYSQDGNGDTHTQTHSHTLFMCVRVCMHFSVCVFL